MNWQPRMEFSSKVADAWFRQASDLRSVSFYMVHTQVLKAVFAGLEKLSIGLACLLKLKITSPSVRLAPATRKNSPKNHWSHTRSQAFPGKKLVLTSFTLIIEITSVLCITIQATTLKDKTASEVIHTLKRHFSRHKLMSDNGPPLNSYEFQ